MVDVLTFEQTLADPDQFSKRHLLLDNGFSIAYRPHIFHYGSLFGRADFGGRDELKQVFEQLNTQDFEVAVRSFAVLRHQRYPMELAFYDAQGAKVWREV